MKQGQDRFIPLPKETKELILMYRREHKLSYRAIERRLGVSRETARLHCLECLPEEKLKVKKVKKKKVVNNNVRVKKKRPIPQYNGVRDYDFLQYIRIVFKWAVKNYPDLTKNKIEMLLYLYPKGAFTYREFYTYYKTIGMYQQKALNEFEEAGYIRVWRERDMYTTKLYTLTEKGKELCDMMHKYCTGDIKMDITDKNAVVADKSVRINSYYVDMIKVMNKRSRNKEE
jgi:DNA-binding MarR family transcriptional regulator